MGNRGPQSFKKRQKEQQRKEKQQEKLAKRLTRTEPGSEGEPDPDSETGEVIFDAQGNPIAVHEQRSQPVPEGT
jgi:hypothetical protein